MKSKHVAVLMGGWNSEREVSLRSGEAAYNALLELGYKTTKIDFGRDIVSKLNEIKPDVVFNALHGRYGEDGRIQGLLDILNIPYTHSGITASAISMDKILTSKICSTVGINSPQFSIIKKGEDKKNKEIIFEKIGKPFVIKPINEGSSVGVQVILENMPFDIMDFDWKYGDEMIVEKYIAGQEIQVAVMDNKALGAIEVRPKKLFYDYECKYTAGMTDYIMPAEVSSDKYEEILDLALRCHKIIGCSGVSRVDFILNNKNNGDNQFYFLEINTHPGFTATSLVPKIAKYKGISFNEIVEYLVNSARCGI
ncbi:MAG: D-alanine--D-alanine ligase [Rickettsiaceae bacterium]|jgi:D-alanine-D-alanine ligase|nr:D-alanine--D-alanine ligase [Rickettsiaceae bacterium]